MPREKTMFRIWCEVCGGVTGSRAAWLKHNGKIAEFATREEAEAEAAYYNKTANGNPYFASTASFRYTVRSDSTQAAKPL
jgi:hypothetical protein